MSPESAGRQDVKTYLRILWRWKLLFLAFLVLIPLGAYLLERGKPKLYQSSALIQPLNTSTSTGSSGSGGSGGSSGSIPVTNLLAAARLVTTTPVAQVAAAFLHPSASPGFLLREVSASADTATGFLTITAQDRNPGRAAAIANAFGAALSKHETRQANHTVGAQIRAYGKQLASTPRTDASGQALLTQEIATLRALRTSVGGGAQVIESAVASATPAVPNTRRAVEIGFVIALLLGIGAVFVAENGDRRLRTPEALERLTNMPLLGTIARSAFSPNRRRSGRDDEAFQMLRASLTYLNVDRSLPSIAIVSPGPQDGKTTVAVGLAIATARAGRRAVLVDADLRRPGVCARLGITATSGLAAVLAKESQLSEVLVEHPVDAPEGGHLLVLPAGDPPPNPSALLGSQEMRTLLGKLEAEADLVIVDTPAALAVGDALPLLHNVSGVMMIVRMNQSSRVAVERLQQVISSAGSAVIGVVATACRAADGYEDYGYYAGTRKRRGLRSALRLRRRRTSTPTRAVTTNASATSAPPSAAQPESPMTVGAQTADPPTRLQPDAGGPEEQPSRLPP